MQPGLPSVYRALMAAGVDCPTIARALVSLERDGYAAARSFLADELRRAELAAEFDALRLRLLAPRDVVASDRRG